MNSSDDETIQRLAQVIKRLIGCIKNYPGDLHNSEFATRYALVDPLLQALGWDVSNIAMVVPEYRIRGFDNTRQYADYALFAKCRRTSSLVFPSVILEAKKYNATRQDMGTARKDAREGAAEAKSQYFAFTDGNYWALYTSSPSNEVTSFKLYDPNGPRTTISTLCQKALPLANSRLGDRPTGTQLGTPLQQPISPRNTTRRGSYRPLNVPQLMHTQWVPLTKAYETLWDSTSKARRQFIVRLPGQIEEKARSWAGIARVVINYLDQNGKLNNLKKSPIKEKSKALFANIEPQHDTGRRFRKLYTAANSGLHFDLDLSAFSLMKATLILLNHASQNPDDIHLKVTPKPTA